MAAYRLINNEDLKRNIKGGRSEITEVVSDPIFQTESECEHETSAIQTPRSFDRQNGYKRK